MVSTGREGCKKGRQTHTHISGEGGGRVSSAAHTHTDECERRRKVVGGRERGGLGPFIENYVVQQ